MSDRYRSWTSTPDSSSSKIEARGRRSGGRKSSSSPSTPTPTTPPLAIANTDDVMEEQRRRHAADQLLAPIQTWRVAEEVVVGTGDSAPRLVKARAWQQATMLQEL
jgi:hypothetical protein